MLPILLRYRQLLPPGQPLLPLRILCPLRPLLPLRCPRHRLLPVLLPALTIGFNNAVLAEASMSFLGIGVTPPDASLGYMLSEAQGILFAAPWYAGGTGLVIVLMVFSVGLLGEGLRRDRGVL